MNGDDNQPKRTADVEEIELGPSIIPEVVEKHLQELCFLWEQRQEALMSQDWILSDVELWEQRMGAHLDALVIAGPEIIPLLKEKLAENDSAITFAGAFVLLSQNSVPAANVVWETFVQAKGEQLDGVRDALSHAPIESMADQLREAVESGTPALSVAAAHVLAVHGRLDPKLNKWKKFLNHDEPAIRGAAWRVVALAGENILR